MPWSKAYDEDLVLERAMLAFWAHGYHATSMAELVAATGINRGSIYAAFTGKRGLFLRALEHYARSRHAATLGDAPGGDPVEAVLAPLAQAAQPPEGRPGGCLILLTGQELAPHDAEIARIVAGHVTALEDHLRRTLKAARAAGKVPATLRPRATAQALVALWAGLHALTRAGAPPEATSGALRSARALLA